MEIKLGQKFKLFNFKGTYIVVRISKGRYLATAISTTGGKASLTKNKPTGIWLASKGNKQLGKVKWLR